MTELQTESLALAVFCGMLFLLFLTPQFSRLMVSNMPSPGHRVIATVLLYTAIVYLVSGLLKGCVTTGKSINDD